MENFTIKIDVTMINLETFIKAKSKKISYVHVVVLFLVYLAFSLFVGGRGMLHKEMDVRLPAHISGKPLLQIIFDNQSMNIGSWEARQLSFLFDILDGKFVEFSIYHGFPHFRSLTHYLFTLIIMLYFWSFLVYTLKIDRLISLLIISLLLTTPSFIYTYYYRTSKIGISLLLIIILCEMYKVIKGKSYPRLRILPPYQLFILFLLATLSLMLFDILGGFFATFIILYMLIAYIYKPDKYKAALLGGMIIGYLIWIIYFLYLGPSLM
jgi:hypothetical protein